MDFVKGSHKSPIVPHADSFDELNLLSRGQEIKVDVAEEDKSSGALALEISLHARLMIHGSGANTSHGRRDWCRDALFEPACEKTKQCARLRRSHARPLRHREFHPLRRAKGLVSSCRSFTL